MFTLLDRYHIPLTLSIMPDCEQELSSTDLRSKVRDVDCHGLFLAAAWYESVHEMHAGSSQLINQRILPDREGGRRVGNY